MTIGVLFLEVFQHQFSLSSYKGPSAAYQMKRASCCTFKKVIKWLFLLPNCLCFFVSKLQPFLIYCDVQDFSLHQSDRNQPSHTDLGYSLTCRTNRVVMAAQRSHVETFVMLWRCDDAWSKSCLFWHKRYINLLLEDMLRISSPKIENSDLSIVDLILM